MSFSLFDVVVLLEDLPSEGLVSGTKGAVVDTFTVPHEAYLVEFCDEDGQTLAMPALLPSQIKLLNNSEAA